MGVRGLTGYIARNAELYLKPYELHDCNLVIDGDNLACNLYKDVTGTYSAFGGDYDDFYRAVVNFFHVLNECNIQAYVLMDGGYEWRKLRTVAKRLRGKISGIKRINPCGSIPIFPLHMKEVFIDAVKDMGIPIMRCVFEADDELAALARKLSCPVLSYDSDFYIYNVRYIPLITLTVKAHTKQCKPDADEDGQLPERSMRKNEAKHVEKRTKADRIMDGIVVNNVEKRSGKRGKTYKYLDCCMYRVENLIQRGSLSKEKMPLFAAMLGNDYIARSAFRNFFIAGMGKIGRSRKMNQQQRRIRMILKWLKHESLETALERIFTRLKKPQRESLMAQVQAATAGYSNELCQSYEYFAENYQEALERYPKPSEEEQLDEASDVDDGEEEYEDSDKEAESEEVADEVTESGEEVANVEEDGNEALSGSDCSDNAEDGADIDPEESEQPANEAEVDTKQKFPAWFLKKLYPADLPRYFVDLLYLRKYINSPQIEHFPYDDCHEIALPILTYIFTLLHSVKGEQVKPRITADGTVLPIEYTYLTRALRVTNVRYYRYGLQPDLSDAYDPSAPNPLLLRRIFEQNIKTVNVDELFSKLDLLPADLRIYFLTLVYWMHKSQHYDLLHMHALIICLVVLRTIDSTIPAERDLRAFQKRFGKIIKKERQVRDKEVADGVRRGIKPELLTLPVPERMQHIPKSDCYLVQDKLLKHFHMQEIFKKKYDLYSTIVLHGFAEFQAIGYQLRSLNALLDFPLEGPRMGQLYCGVLLYNLYDLLRPRLDLRYYVEHFLFPDSRMMFDFYCYLVDWCEEFIPHWKRNTREPQAPIVTKKMLKKKRQAARKLTAQQEIVALNEQERGNSKCDSDNQDDESFYSLNNKFNVLLSIR